LARKKFISQGVPGPDEAEPTLNLKRLHKGARARLEEDMQVSFDETSHEDLDDEVVEHHTTWQKVVEHKTPPALPAIVISSTSGARTQKFRLAPWRSPRTFFWLCTAALCILLLAGGFGMALGFARNTSRQSATSLFSLQASPSTIALGGILTLRGVHFTPHGKISLSRDSQSIPVVDTGGMNSIETDAHGAFSDTVVVDPMWFSGPHALYATDIRTHHQSAFKIAVTGQNALQGPPYLLLSSNTLDLGSGDEATNGSKLLALSNAGGGQVSWQANISQPWLQISPRSGTIASGGHLSTIVAADRSNLAPGTYHTTIAFVSNTEQISLAVTMAVTPLQANHEAVLQVSPAALAFTASAEGSNPQDQTITVSNPGVQTLNWGAGNGLQGSPGWLSMTPGSGSIAPGGQQQITVGASTAGLAAGIYKSTLLFANQGSQPIQGDAQSIYVSLTVTPACILTFSHNSLSFTAVHSQGSPAAQALNVTVASGCTMQQNWKVSVSTSSGGHWLSVNTPTATTPSTPQVYVNTTGLVPGKYSGALSFTVNTGLQIVPVVLTIGPLPCTIDDANTLTLQGAAGQATPATQAITISSSGDCPHTLDWTSAVSGASWLSATSSGTLSHPGTANINVQGSLVGLSAGTYTGTMTITVVDSGTGAIIGTAKTTIILKALPPCTLAAPSTSPLTFTASVGNNPAQPTASFTISVTGNCAGDVTITPAVSASGSGWLTVSGPATIASGNSATFTVTVASSSLAAGTFSAKIKLDAADGSGNTTDSPQSVTVTLTVG
jgi:hypothetical protein